jgi:membrane-associated protease RseP (regulator of RpoE activity)
VTTDGGPLSDPFAPRPVRPGEFGEPGTWIATPPPPSPPKFQHRYGRHLVLLVLTLLTTSLSGSCHYLNFEASVGSLTSPIAVWPFLMSGLTYSVPLLLILGAHEFGHYYYCRRHDVDATLPYFLPAPIPLTGTVGAVIRIREAFPSKRALFDIGVAGPIAGFVVMLPLLYWGITMSAVVRFPENTDLIYFGEPLLLKAMAWLHFGDLPEGFDIVLHPMGFAAWFGMLATALNLLPFGQLDGGHISYALFGRQSWLVSLATLATAVLLTLRSSSWFFITLMLLAMALFLGLRHPRVIDEEASLDGQRALVALLALIMFLICFTPVPIEMFFASQ